VNAGTNLSSVRPAIIKKPFWSNPSIFIYYYEGKIRTAELVQRSQQRKRGAPAASP
jgi:hypothetical protein